jgi:hypothetical protein
MVTAWRACAKITAWQHHNVSDGGMAKMASSASSLKIAAIMAQIIINGGGNGVNENGGIWQYGDIGSGGGISV